MDTPGTDGRGVTPVGPLRCELGEGALWHPERGEFYCFDILGRRLHGPARAWDFDEMVSAAGWIDRDRLLIASETRLMTFDLATGAAETLCPLEADRPDTRSNDGRADPQGGFWIGTMGKRAEPGAGAIWRWHRGELRRLWSGITIPNAISFPPGGRSACFTDTATRQVMRVALDAAGWPQGRPEVWLDLTAEGLNPDGAVFDAEGRHWLALWGAGRVAVHAPDGTLVRSVTVPAAHTTCPAFGGEGLGDLYVTSARHGLATPSPLDGAVFRLPGAGRGQAEPRVLLPAAS
jgi:sugar lactone lactonase YvrE